MIYTIELLLNGNANVVDYYQAAKYRWQEISKQPEFVNENDLAQFLTHEQSWFEDHCGGRGLGPEIMVITGAYYFSPDSRETEVVHSGTHETVKRILAAFEKSGCSVEVKMEAEQVAEELGIAPG